MAGNPDCPVCNGAGFRLREGLLYPVSPKDLIPCSCYGFWRGQGELPPEPEQTFENFKPSVGNHNALKFSQELATGQSKFIWLLITGAPGCGKSHLLRAIQKTMKSRSVHSVLYNCPDLFANLKTCITDNTIEMLMANLKNTFSLLLDDYGAEYGSEWEKAKFDELMVARFSLYKPTVVATNLTLSQIPERVLSRFRDASLSRIVHNSAPDYRPGKK